MVSPTSSMDISKPIVMQIVPVKVNGSQNKTKRKECEMGPFEKGEREINGGCE